ncbi:MAG TPA: hypothetical protein VG900_14105 [Hyphomicrobiaceae bacterium]|jgi:hypothetical protein|nr:hypothetical protein [Hyphomicrobiaceae bacterium]
MSIQSWPFALAVVLTLPLAACSGVGIEDTKAGFSCIDDSPECVGQRQTALNALMTSEDKSWVKETATPQAHASGVRLFALRARKADLSCEELAHGRREAESAPKVLKSAANQGLTPAQISRASMFAAEVSKELSAEMRRRHCKA